MDNFKRVEPSSFRDPAGVIFFENGEVYRQVNKCYQKQYESLMSCGLYEDLVKKEMLIPHKSSNIKGISDEVFCVIKPQKVPFISYPYEWSFGQIKDAALVTLKMHRIALNHNMILKDASAYNIQFVNGKAVLIDTLSFGFYTDGMPWVAYGQFCRHFLSTLFMMSCKDMRLSQMLRTYIDGIPLDLASCILKGKGGFAVKQHIHWHARSVQDHAQDGKKEASKKKLILSKTSHIAMIDSLIRIVEGIKHPVAQTEWGDYYLRTNYSDKAAANKLELVRSYLKQINPLTLWDFGANDGTYSRLGLEYPGANVVAFDIDYMAVERNYQAIKKSHEAMLPLLLDLTNPSPSIGFANHERVSIEQRQKPDCILMLAVIHHLAISNNLPLDKIANWLQSLCDYLVIEFVPKDDSQVEILLATRDDIFPHYNMKGFEEEFGKYFSIVQKKPVEASERTLYLLKSN